MCEGPAVGVVSRLDYVLYLRCPTCGHVWSADKPGVVKIGQ
jgi:hypothetical protein